MKRLLTVDLEMSNACDLSGLVACCTLIDALILGEGTGQSESVCTIGGVHLEILAGFDDLVVVVPLHHGFWNSKEKTLIHWLLEDLDAILKMQLSILFD